MKKIDILNLQLTILSRYKKNKRALPWRETFDPYAIHVSEVMSQQTQVDRVVPYWNQWMHDIPDYKTLSQSQKMDILSHRSGLGFNSRALRLQECAKIVMNNYGGQLPKDRDLLLQLPGIGKYTASAICSFAWNLPEPVIDTNIRRVLIFLLKLPLEVSNEELEKIARELIPKGKSRDRNNALMDYGAICLTARKTKIRSLGRQSKFEGSDREVRGRILKKITSIKGPITLEAVEQEFPNKDVETIVDGMIKEKILQKKGNTLLIE